ncbi:unnamed protein product [Effrenium voratum]|uniref:Sulfatase N-terminal domain-containing protein n=1 Tax=Effrenium voratum TaxID=2562239 RepID=A0AA36J632_9DINO|nr:unnamed protein product [Effrenium voratum]CAJ1418237.1 unnamed protein product [Effrenium voratum]
MRALVAFLALLGAVFAKREHSGRETTPNLMLLLADQFRFDLLEEESLPNLRRLGQEGASFQAHYSSTPTCTPARAALLTGRSPWGHGMLGYGAVAPRYELEMARALEQHSAVVGKNHFGWDRRTQSPKAHGYQHLQIYDGLGNGFVNGSEFDDYDQWFQQQLPGQDPLRSGGLDWNSWRGAPYDFEEKFHPTAWTGRRAREALQHFAAAGDPFFLKVSFHRPHSPYDPPRRLLDATPPPKSAPAKAADQWDDHFRNCSQQGEQDAWCGEVAPAALNLTRRAYRASARFVDEEVGRIMQELEGLGLKEKTFILFTSDHGDQQMDHFLWRKGYPYEAASHIPLLLRWPESMDLGPRGVKVSEVTELRDIFPTFLAVSGLWNETLAQHMEGRPLTQLLRTGKSQWRKWVDLEHDVVYSPEIHWSALTDGRMKFVFLAHTGEEQLFDLQNDPSETHNLAKEPSHASELRTWRERMVRQFEAEDRGEEWVSGGRLQVRQQSCLYGPNYPLPTKNCRLVAPLAEIV